MAKATFGEHAAFHTQGGIRFQTNNKLVSEKAIPPEAAAYLKKALGEPVENIQPPTQTFAPPTEEEKARLRAESLQTPPELARTPEEMAAATPDEPLSEADFDVPEVPTQPDMVPQNQTLEPKTENVESQSDFLEQVSIHTASIEDIAEALYNRFGLYTVYLNKLPVADEFNPLTGEQFSKYHLGIAYQAAIRAQNQGILNRPAEQGRAIVDEGRAASENFQVDPLPRTVGEARRMNTFDHRTSPEGVRDNPSSEVIHVKDPVTGELHAERREIPEGQTGQFNGARARYDREEEEVLVEPKIGGKPIIRPDW